MVTQEQNTSIEEEKQGFQIGLSQLFSELTIAYTNLKSYHARAIQGVEVVAPIIYKDNIEFTSNHLPTMLRDAGAPLEKGELSEEWHISAAERAVKEASERNRAIIDSSTLVFAHSLFDGFIEDLVMLTKSMYPEFWYSRISKRKIEVDEVQNDGFEKVKIKLVDNLVKEKIKESVLVRCELLMSLLQPKREEVFAVDFRYDADLLKEIDDKRHSIVHRTRKYMKIENLMSYIDYLEKFNSFFVIGFLRRFGLRLDHQTVIRALATQ